MTTTAAAAPDNNNNDATRAAELARQTSEREDQLRRLREEDAIDRVFQEFPSKFKIPHREVLKAVGTIVRFDADGQPLVNGVLLSDALGNYARVNPHAVADTVAETHDKGLSSVKSKADLRTIKEKSDYISTFGERQYSKLPLTALESFDESTLSIEQYRRLPVATKTKLIDKHGPDFASRLLKAQREQEAADRLAGIPYGVKKK